MSNATICQKKKQTTTVDNHQPTEIKAINLSSQRAVINQPGTDGKRNHSFDFCLLIPEVPNTIDRKNAKQNQKYSYHTKEEE